MKKYSGAVVVLICLGWLAWPYYALYSLASAFTEGDTAAIENRVAWDSVRQNLRGDLNAMLLQKLRDESGGNSAATGLAILLGPTIINQLVDSYVTPQAVSTLIRTGKPTVSIGGTPTADNAASGEQKHRLDFKKQVRFAFFSGGPFTFKVKIAPEEESLSVQKEIGLLFKWSGDWKLTRIILPMDAFQSARRAATPSGHQTVRK